jgi:seryl-tRNA synthetase
MLDMEFIRANAARTAQNSAERGMPVDINRLLELDEQIRSHLRERDDLRSQRNRNAELLAALADKTSTKAQALIKSSQELKQQIGSLDAELEHLQPEFEQLRLAVPNLTHPNAPLGRSDRENIELRQVGTPPTFSFTPKSHLELSKALDLYDFERGADVSGSGFYFARNEAALLELGIQQYALDVSRSHGYTPMVTPDLARPEVLLGTGYNPRGEETQIYTVDNSQLALIATSEITVGGYFQGKTFTAEEIAQPVRIAAISHCFRTEAGAYGRESRGLYRVHQFSKVELFVLCRPEDSEAMHQEILSIEEKILQGLELPYRVVDCCTGDLGASAFRKYDIEAWMPFKDGWGEVTSASNCTDFQARRLGIKFVADDGQRQYVHTLNGTAAVTSRLPLAILENFQQPDGSVRIPTVLHPYTLGVTEIRRA